MAHTIKGISDSEEKARITGEIDLVKPESLPSDFVEFAKLDAATVLGWVKDALGTDEVSRLETTLEAEVNLVITPTTAVGVPW